MATYCCPPNLPQDESDLNSLIDWFITHDVDWIADALWLRYLRIVKQVYHCNDSAVAWGFERLRYGEEGSKNKRVPMPCAILPEIQASDKRDIDRLSALPHDIRVEVLSYLLLQDTYKDMHGCLMFRGHPLNKLALVSRAWRDQVDGFCGHSLLVWKQLAEERNKYFNDYEPSWVEWRKLATYTPNARMEAPDSTDSAGGKRQAVLQDLRRRLAVTLYPRSTSTAITAAASLSIFNHVFVSGQRFIFFLVFGVVVPMDRNIRFFPVCLGHKQPVSSLIVKNLSALHVFLLLDFVVDYGAGEDE